MQTETCTGPSRVGIGNYFCLSFPRCLQGSAGNKPLGSETHGGTTFRFLLYYLFWGENTAFGPKI